MAPADSFGAVILDRSKVHMDNEAGDRVGLPGAGIRDTD